MEPIAVFKPACIWILIWANSIQSESAVRIYITSISLLSYSLSLGIQFVSSLQNFGPRMFVKIPHLYYLSHVAWSDPYIYIY
jgi:hypothetical protein